MSATIAGLFVRRAEGCGSADATPRNAGRSWDWREPARTQRETPGG